MPRRRKGGWWERKGGSPGATSLASSGDEAPTPTIGRGFLWYDPVAGAFMVSEDGAAAAPIGGGGGGTPGSSVVAETSFGQATAVGASAAFAREDHSHGTPANPLPAHVAAADPHPAYLLADGSRALTGSLAAGGNRLTGVAAPIAATDAATKDYVDALVQGLDWQESVLAQQSAPPGAPTTGDRYLVGAAPTGAWVGHADEVAEWDGAAWQFQAPTEGAAVWNEATDALLVFNGAAWVTFGSTTDHGTLLGLADDDHAQYLLASGARALAGALSMGGFKLTNVATPTLATDAATKGYVDTLTPAAAGSDTWLQYNNAGALGASAGFVVDKTNRRLAIVGDAMTRTPSVGLHVFGADIPGATVRIQQESSGVGNPQARLEVRGGGPEANVVSYSTSVSGTWNGTLGLADSAGFYTSNNPSALVISARTAPAGRVFIGGNGGTGRFGLIVDTANNVVVGSNGDNASGSVTATALLEIRGLAGTPALIVNESGVDSDTRIESDGNANAFFLDANNGLLGAAGAIGLFTATPLSGFDVQTSQGIKRVTVVDASYTVLDDDFLVAYTSLTVPRTTTLPLGSGRAGRVVVVKDESGSAGANPITIAPSGADTIDGAASKSIAAAYGRMAFYSDGANWHVLHP